MTSLERINELHPLIRDAALFAYNQCVGEGINIYITETLRTFIESDRLYQQGRTLPGKIVSNAKAGSSYHNYGLALDFVIMKDNKPNWIVSKDWLEVVDIFKSQNFSWGGDFKSLKDYPHLENRLGYDWRDLLRKYNLKKFIPGSNYLDL